MRMWLALVIFFVSSRVVMASEVAPAPARWTPIRESMVSGEPRKALDKLLRLDDDKLTAADRATKYFALGVLAYEQKKWPEARSHLERSLELRTPLTDLANYFLGLVAKETRQLGDASRFFDRALAERPPRSIEREVRYQRGEILVLQNKWREARNVFVALERKSRRQTRHPFVLWQLVGIELQLKNRSRACEWMRDLHEKYPEHPLTAEWGVDLAKATYNGDQLLCAAGLKHQRARVRTLQARGLSTQARLEIDSLTAANEKLGAFTMDTLRADFFISDGYSTEAVNILLKHYAENLRNYDYMMMLGRAAARSGNYPVAIAAYSKAAALIPGRRSMNAEFQAAFLTYQYQDYDGALRKFTDFSQRWSGSALARDAQWYLTWVHYLRQDHSAALKGLRRIMSLAQKSKKQWANFPMTKLRYWEAMTLLRMGQFKDAAGIFFELSKDRSLEYYAIASQERLKDLDTHLPSPVVFQDPDKSKQGEPLTVPGMLLPDSSTAQAPSPAATDPTEIIETESGSEAEMEEDLADEGDEVGEEADSEPQMVLASKDPRLSRWFDRARDLIQVGFNDLAEDQLYEIETHTSNFSYLKTILGAYQGIGAYYRSAYMGEIQFGFERRRFGLSGVRHLWEAAFPRAFERFVALGSGRTGVAEELIWGIMRAESFYRPTIVSPVGAMGLMQVMPFTGRQVAFLDGQKTFQEQSLFDPAMNIRIASQYLVRLTKIFDGQLPLIAAAYNAGPHRVESWLAAFGRLEMDEFIEHIPFFETRNYTKKVVRNFVVYSRLYNKRPVAVRWLAEPIKGVADRTFKERETWESL